MKTFQLRSMQRFPFNCRTLMAMIFSVAFLSDFDAVGQTDYCHGCGPDNNCNGVAGSSGYCSFAAGEDAEADGNNSISIGYKSVTTANSSLVFGNLLATDGASQSNMVVGFGIASTTTQLINDMSNTIMIGANSDVSTVFIGNSGGTTGSYGNVGIGNVTSPASLLHVRSQIRVGLTSGANGSLVFNNSAGNTITFNAPTSMSTQSYILPTAIGTNGDILGLGTSGQLQWVSPGAVTDAWLLAGNSDATSTSKLGTLSNQPLMIYANNAERMRVTTNGNVGIGTTAPDGILHVRTTANTNLRLERAVGSSGYLRFNAGTSETGSVGMDSQNDLRIINSASGQHMRFFINFGGSTEVMRIHGANAYVGIGVSSPDDKLHVYESGENTAIRIQKDDANRGQLSFHTGATENGYLQLTDDEDMGLYNVTQDRHIRLSVNDGGTQTQALFIEGSSANVGIGTTTPQGRLHVDGDTYLAVGSGLSQVGIGTATPQGRLDVNGTLFAQLTGGGTGSPMLYNSNTGEILEDNSTIQMKEEIQDLQIEKEQVLALRPVSFRWKQACGGQTDIGLIAEEVGETLPELAIYGFKRTFIGSDGDLLRDSLGIPVVDSSQFEVRGVNYPKLSLYLLGVVKQQDSLMQEMNDRIRGLEDVVQACCSSGAQNRVGTDESSLNQSQKMVNSEIIEEYVLLRNDPNPFSDYTDIKYEASDCRECQIVIVDFQGRIVKRISVKGDAGTIRVYSSEIGNGMFTYSIVRNGVAVATSKMISSR
ncbi:MAG: hypothetical protein RL266_288 [Bacteroidota bacterium]|jgi:hypothetical protein